MNIVKQKFEEELKSKKLISSIYCTPGKNNFLNNDVSTFCVPCESFSFSSSSLEKFYTDGIEESINDISYECHVKLTEKSESSDNKENSLISLLNIEENICFDECDKNNKWNCVKKSKNEELDQVCVFITYIIQ